MLVKVSATTATVAVAKGEDFKLRICMGEPLSRLATEKRRSEI